MAIEGAGTSGAVREVFESSIALGLMALARLEVDPRTMEDVEAALRQLDEARLAAQIDEGDMAAGGEHRFKPWWGREEARVADTLSQAPPAGTAGGGPHESGNAHP